MIRDEIRARLAKPAVKQEAFDRHVGLALAVGLAVIALAGAVFLIIDIARSGGV
jgi:hypothetical protein